MLLCWPCSRLGWCRIMRSGGWEREKCFDERRKWRERERERERERGMIKVKGVGRIMFNWS